MRGKTTILIGFIGLAGFLSICSKSSAQIYSSNIVGYINLQLSPGDNLIANQLLSQNDTLTNLFQYGVPEGATFTKWNSSLNQYLPVSTYHSSSGWDINYGLTLGEGGLFHTPTAFINTLVGTVWPGWNSQYPFNTPLVSGSGTLLLSCMIPIQPATFYDMVGRNPQNGESVTTLNALSQLYSTTTFQNGTWDNGTPTLSVGQSAFFNLEPVPEPSVLGLFGASGALLFVLGKSRKSKFTPTQSSPAACS